MRTDGPEFQRGWRSRIDVDGVTALVEARHFDRNRMPTGHEIARQAMRSGGLGFHMVRTPVYEWAVLLQEGAMGRCTIRPTLSGDFEVAGTRRVHRTLEEAVRTWATAQVTRAAEARAMRADPAEEDLGPRP
jgi:hypothetical protein